MSDVNLFERLKKIVLLRERDRKPREGGIKILKKLIKLEMKIILDIQVTQFHQKQKKGFKIVILFFHWVQDLVK